MKLNEIKQLDVGDEVSWEDPDDGTCSGIFFVTEIVTENGRLANMEDVLIIRNDQGSVVEVYASELR